MHFYDRIHKKLTDSFSPVFLDIQDESAQHAGHAHRMVPIGTRAGNKEIPEIAGAGETHFKVTIVSSAFCDQPQQARHRQVYAALREELKERVHALSIRTYTPEEYDKAL